MSANVNMLLLERKTMFFLPIPPAHPSPHFYCFPSSSSSFLLFSLFLHATFLLFSLPLYISIIFPSPPPPHFCCFPSSSQRPPPPHFYCFSSSSTTTTILLLFSLLLHHHIRIAHDLILMRFLRILFMR